MNTFEKLKQETLLYWAFVSPINASAYPQAVRSVKKIEDVMKQKSHESFKAVLLPAETVDSYDLYIGINEPRQTKDINVRLIETLAQFILRSITSTGGNSNSV